MRYMHCVPGEAMMGLMSGVMGTHGYARGPRATGHVAAPEPSRTRRRVWSHWTRGGTRAQSVGGPGASITWQRQSLPAQGAGLEPRGMWRLRSLLLPGDGLGASGHVATPEPSPSGWRARCLGARSDTGALSWRETCSVQWGKWRHRSPLLAGGVLCASGHVAKSEPSGTGNGPGAVGLIF
jgi:hypothetical protein